MTTTLEPPPPAVDAATATAPPATRTATLFVPVTHCWCGARGAADSPFSSAYFACGRCGTHFSKQRLRSAEAVAEFYSLGGYWRERQEQKGHPALEARPEIIAESGRVDHWLETLRRHRPTPAPGEDAFAVEVGCAEAAFLQRLAAEGWHCRGLEPDAATARLVADRTGLDIRGGVFPEPVATAAARGCDLFIACDVLEHSPDPVRFLFAAGEALREGGTLFLQMPMLGWDPATPFGFIQAGVFDAQEHAFIFSRASLQRLLEGVGFEVLENTDAWIRGHELVVARKRATQTAAPAPPLLGSLARVRRACRGYGVEIHLDGARHLPHAVTADGGEMVSAWEPPSDRVLLSGWEGLGTGSLDYIFSSRWLVTVERWTAALAGWRERLRPGGTLALLLPHPDTARWQRGAPEVGERVRWRAEPATLVHALAGAGFEVTECGWAPDAEGDFLILARRGAATGQPLAAAATRAVPGAPWVAQCRLGDVAELSGAPFVDFMGEMNAFAAPLGLQTFSNLSKVWEYPWLWFHGLQHLHWPGTKLADLGSELSPLPWWLATLGARVHLVEVHDRLSDHWAWLRERLGVRVEWTVVDPAQPRLPFAGESLDVLTSFSVLEHQSDQAAAADEAARVLKPGGLLALSFDLCEPARGMTFPAWNGHALSMADFERLVWHHPAFDPGARPEWNLGSIEPFQRWHEQSAPHHRYVVGAATLFKRRGPPGLRQEGQDFTG